MCSHCAVWSPLSQPEGDVTGRRQFTVTARKFEFEPEVIDVRRNDIVRLTITSADIDHSFTIDAYRIQKRIPAGGSVTSSSAPTKWAGSRSTAACASIPAART